MDLGLRTGSVAAHVRVASPRSRENMAAARRGVAGDAVGAGGVPAPEPRGDLVGAARRQLGARRALADAGPGGRRTIFFARMVRSFPAVPLLRADRRVQPAAAALAIRPRRSERDDAVRGAGAD